MNRLNLAVISKTTEQFSPGNTYITPGALGRVNPLDVYNCLRRHICGDWGDCCSDDVAANERAMKEGRRMVSVYRDRGGVKFWIITEADRTMNNVQLHIRKVMLSLQKC